MSVDFSQEILLVEEAISRLQQELVETPNGTKADCSCGNSNRQHVLERLIALDVLWEALSGNFKPLANSLEVESSSYLIFMAVQILSSKQEIEDLIRRLQLGMLGENPGATPNNRFGLLN